MLAELQHDNPLWMHPRRAARLGLSDGDEVEVSHAAVVARMRLSVTPLIHEDAVFMLHGFGRTVPSQKRAYRVGVADQRLQSGMLPVYDPAGGGSAMTETVVRVRAAKAEALA